jgi:hypothetical protein
MIGGVLALPQPPRWPARRSSIWRRAVELEVSPCRVCVFGPSVDSTRCQHDGGDEENAGHRSGVCVGERREIGVAHAAVAWGNKKSRNNEAKVTTLLLNLQETNEGG